MWFRKKHKLENLSRGVSRCKICSVGLNIVYELVTYHDQSKPGEVETHLEKIIPKRQIWESNVWKYYHNVELKNMNIETKMIMPTHSMTWILYALIKFKSHLGNGDVCWCWCELKQYLDTGWRDKTSTNSLGIFLLKCVAVRSSISFWIT